MLKAYITLLLFMFILLSVRQESASAGALDDPNQMAPFFADAQMKMIKPDDELKAAWEAMSVADRMKFRSLADQMERGVRQPNSDFVRKIKELSGGDAQPVANPQPAGDIKKP